MNGNRHAVPYTWPSVAKRSVLLPTEVDVHATSSTL